MKSIVHISSVDKSFALLEFLASQGKPVSLQEITEKAKLPKPTVYRLLRILQELGYVVRPAHNRNYQIGPRVALLTAADPYSVLKTQMHPLMQSLHTTFNETVNLGVLVENKVLYLDFIETTEPLRFTVSKGATDAFYSTALGRAIAAQLPPHILHSLIAKTPLTAFTHNTITSSQLLRERIAEAHKNEFAEELEESVEGVCCLAISLAKLGFPDAAISIAIPKQRLTSERRTSILKALKNILKTTQK